MIVRHRQSAIFSGITLISCSKIKQHRAIACLKDIGRLGDYFNCRDEKSAEDIPDAPRSRMAAVRLHKMKMLCYLLFTASSCSGSPRQLLDSYSLERNNPATVRIGGHRRNSAPTDGHCKIGHQKMCSHSCDAAALSRANSMAVANSTGSKSENLMRC
jgi:hypothetical protein